jgi:CheY-like chemotaxis protein
MITTATATATTEELKLRTSTVPQPIADFRVLVVDDSDINRRILARMLESEGFSVVMAHNGLEAIEAVSMAEVPYSIIFMDVVMPLLDGVEATRKLRERNIGTPIVALTANAMTNDQQRCAEAGMTTFISKPFSKKEIISVIRRFGTPELSQVLDARAHHTGPKLPATSSTISFSFSPMPLSASSNDSSNSLGATQPDLTL